MNAHEAKELFKYEPTEEFTIIQLKSRFRQLSLTAHPDRGGSESEFIQLQDAYDLLNHQATIEAQENDITVEGVPLADLGKGYPLTESAKTCESCKGKGYRSYRETERTILVDCEECGATGLLRFPCKRCNGTGKYTHPQSHRVVGECFACKGSGWFYPVNKRRINFLWEFLHAINYIPGTKKLGVPCKSCNGDGKVPKPVKTDKMFYHKCPKCEGIGEIKMWNPVLPRGYLANG